MQTISIIKTMNSYEATERFHLMFMGYLAQRLNPRLFAVKGGCNLRFYFKSVRYSEDIDFDVHTVSPETLRSNVRHALRNQVLTNTLRAVGIEISKTSEPKQTDTTQRWKVSLSLPGFDREIPTKIEFSRRDGLTGAVVEPVDRDLIVKYNLYPIHVSHYPRGTAIRQKVSALIGRTQTQARDIFDLALLIHDTLDLEGYTLTPAEAEEACDHALSLNFDDFQGQVVAFLLPDYQRTFGTSQMWNEMVLKVLDFIRRVPHEPA